MGKKPKEAAPSHSDATFAVHLPESFVANYGEWTLDATHLSTMSPKAISYLLVNGFRQSIVDAAAFGKDEKEGKTGDEIAAMQRESRGERFAAILSGEVGTRVGGPRATPVESVMRQIAEREVKAAFEAKGISVSSAKDAFKKNVGIHLERQATRLRATAEEELAKAKSVGDIELDMSVDAPTATE